MKNRLKVFFFLGKGGVGKSTTSALLSMALSGEKKKVLLASFDYAHNQSDIFERKISDKPVRINSHLEVLQVNREKEVKSFLKKTTKDMKKNYSYLSSFNLEGYFDVLKYSPGMEEYALVTTFMKVKEKAENHDYLIIDMPPTALALRFFNLPTLTLTWLSELEKLRVAIYKKKKIISKIKFAGKEVETDRVLEGLRDIKNEYEELKGIFQSDNSNIFTVYNDDMLSINETQRVISELEKLNIKTENFVCNSRNNTCGFISSFIPVKGQVNDLPFSEMPLIGEKALQKYLEINKETILQLI